jgi:hypothetical protein
MKGRFIEFPSWIGIVLEFHLMLGSPELSSLAVASPDALHVDYS